MRCKSCGVHAGPMKRLCAACRPAPGTCTRCKTSQAMPGREACTTYAQRAAAGWVRRPRHQADDSRNREPRRHARSESLRPVVEIGPGTSLGLEVVTFEVIQ